MNNLSPTRSHAGLWSMLLVALIALAAAALYVGSTQLSMLSADKAHYILLHLRLPAMLMAICAGASLSVSGLTMQTVMGNPLADPSLLGITAGAALGCGIALMAGGAGAGASALTAGYLSVTMLFALLGAVAVMAVLVACSSVVRQKSTLLLVGVMINFLVSSVVGVMAHFAATDRVKQFVEWGLGSVTTTSLSAAIVACVICLCFSVIILYLAHPLDALLLGEQYAEGVGHNVRRIRTILLLSLCVLTAVVTALCGPIAFLGLAVPHMARRLFGTSTHRLLLPATALLGAITLLCCHLVCQLPALLFHASILPVGILTPLIGAPIVLVILLSKAR